MKALLLVLVASVCVASATFEGWMSEYQKTYSSAEEQEYRKSVYDAAVLRVAELNAQGAGMTHYHVGQWADLTPAEWRAQHLTAFDFGDVKRGMPETAPMKRVGDLPKEFDWREKGAVNAIKDQGQCGSCWAFSAVCAMEAAHYMASKSLLSFAEQQILDCDHNDSSCNGGWPWQAVQYVMDNHGIQSEDTYPYLAVDQPTCAYDASKSVANVSSYAMLPKDEKQMQQYLFDHGPISIAVDASDWQYYYFGIWFGSCSDDPNMADHAVAVVGWGKDWLGIPFWIVRNSWGESWGESGYMKLHFGVNKCGVANYALQVY